MIRDWKNYYTEEEIKIAFYDVMYHQYKKDCNNPLSHEIIKNLGYKIEKYDGRYIIENIKTGKRISIVTKYKKPYVEYDTGKGRCYFEWGEIPNFDYINYLEKPFNKEYRREIITSKYRGIRNELSYHKRWLNYKKDEVEKAKKAIQKAIENLEYQINELNKEKNSINNIRKEYGLKGI